MRALSPTIHSAEYTLDSDEHPELLNQDRDLHIRYTYDKGNAYGSWDEPPHDPSVEILSVRTALPDGRMVDLYTAFPEVAEAYLSGDVLQDYLLENHSED